MRKENGFWSVQRPKNLFSYLLKCGCCGGGFSKVSKNHYGCTTARNKGTCKNLLTIRQDEMENAILGALQSHLMDPTLCEVFCKEYAKTLQETRQQFNAKRRGFEAALQKLAIQMDKYIDAIGEGLFSPSLKEKIENNEARQAELKEILSKTEEVDVLIHPSMANRYRDEVSRLIESLNAKEHRSQAAQLLRSLIDKIVLTPKPDQDELSVDLVGDLAGILQVALDKKTPPEDREFIRKTVDTMQKAQAEPELEHIVQDKMGAGAGFEPATFGL
jgi:site-specific DNA recombinase